MKTSLLKPLGWTSLFLASLLAVGTVWVYGAVQQSLGSLPHSVARATAAAAEAMAALAKTTTIRADIATDAVRTLSAAQSALARVKVSAERQVAQLPRHEATLRAVAVNTRDLSHAANRVADALSVEVPLLKARPFEVQARAVRPFADSLARATVSLNDAADAVRSDAVPIAKAMIELSVSGTSLAEHARQGAETVRSQHLPQLASALEQAASTLLQTSTQVLVAPYLAMGILVLGLLLAASLALQGVALLTIAAAVNPGFVTSAAANKQGDVT